MQRKSSNSVKIYYPKYNKEKIIKLLKAKIHRIKKKIPVKKVILFGSYASGKYTVASDIDILIVYKGPKREDAYNICWDIIEIPELQLHIYSEEEYAKLKQRNSSIPKEAETQGVIIWEEST